MIEPNNQQKVPTGILLTGEGRNSSGGSKDSKDSSKEEENNNPGSDSEDLFGTIVVTEDDHREDFVQQLQYLTFREPQGFIRWEQLTCSEGDVAYSVQLLGQQIQEDLIAIRQDILSEMRIMMSEEFGRFKADLNQGTQGRSLHFDTKRKGTTLSEKRKLRNSV